MDQELIQKAYKAVQKGQKYAFATIIDSTLKGTPRKAGAKMLIFEDGSIWGTIGGGRNERSVIKSCLKVMKTGKTATVTYDYFGKKGQSICGGQIRVFMEPFLPTKRLIICGGGHIGLALSFIGKMNNFEVTVIDSRKDYANRKRFPHVDRVVCGAYTKKLSQLTFDKNTYIMIVTHGNEHDFEALKTVVKKDAGYIGVISSRAKRIKFFNRLKKMGVAQKFLKRIDIPAGIDVGAQSPQEIAISIAAGIISQQNKGLIGTDKFLEKI